MMYAAMFLFGALTGIVSFMVFVVLHVSSEKNDKPNRKDR